jgi:hypothetical protein
MQLMETNQVGKRESLADIIAVAESDATPYTAMAHKRKKPGAVTHDWQVKSYAGGGHRGVQDGKDASEFQSNPRERLHGVAQKLWHNPAVSDFAEESTVAGAPKGEMKEQVADALIALARKIEKRLLSNNDCTLEAAPSATNETRGIFSWLSTGAQTLYPVPEAFRPNANQVYSGTLAAFKESSLINLAKAAYKRRKGKGNLKGIVGVDLKTRIAEFSKYSDDVASTTAVRTFNQAAGDKAIINVIDRVTLDTGTIDLMLSSFLRTDADTGEDTDYTHRSGVFIDPSMTALYYTRLPRVKPLEYKGGGHKAICDTILMHGVDNPIGMFKAEISADS